VCTFGVVYLGKDLGCGCLRLLLRKIFGPKQHVVKEENKKRSFTSSLLNIIQGIRSRIMSREENGAYIWKSRAVYRVLIGKLERKRPLGRPKRRWYNI
jgi:hypothetical protein